MIWPSGSANQVPEAALAFLIKKKRSKLVEDYSKNSNLLLVKNFRQRTLLGHCERNLIWKKRLLRDGKPTLFSGFVVTVHFLFQRCLLLEL